VRAGASRPLAQVQTLMNSPLDAFPDAGVDEPARAPRARARTGRISRRVATWSIGTLVLAGVITLVVLTTVPPGGPGKSGGGKLAGSITASVSAGAATTQSVTTRVVVAGTVGAPAPPNITPQVAGPIASIAIHPGEPVRAGQVVARLSDTQGLAAKQAQAQAALAQAQSALDTAASPQAQPQAVAQAQNQVDAAQTALRTAQQKQQADEAAAGRAASPPATRANRTPSAGPSTAPPSHQQLSADADAVAAAQRQLRSAQSYLSAVAHPSSAPSTQLSAAQSAVTAAQAAVDAATAAVAQLNVTAQVDGTIAEVSAQVGDPASPNTPIAVLAGNASIVSARVPPMVAHQLAGHIGADGSIRLAVPDPPPAIKAHLSFVAPAADAQTQQTDITLSADSGSLAPGEPVTATVNVALGRRVTVPSGAVSYVNGAPGVYALTGLFDPAALGLRLPAALPAGSQVGTATFTPVNIIATTGGRTAIEGGLPAKTRIVTTGQNSISTGQRVAVLPAPTGR
jgi:multidrug efflux pump subunit AcrA (membrane-fusion protein)